MARTFNDRPFAERFAYMGDTAEQSVIDAHNGKVVRFGLERPPFALRNLPVELRGAPDFIGGKAFYEACGVGRDQVVKVKKYKHEAQLWWSALLPVVYHVFDPVNKRWVEIEASVIQDLIDDGHIPLREFDSDKVQYWAIDMELVMANACDGGPTS
jgi:hypothetical protein